MRGQPPSLAGGSHVTSTAWLPAGVSVASTLSGTVGAVAVASHGTGGGGGGGGRRPTSPRYQYEASVFLPTTCTVALADAVRRNWPFGIMGTLAQLHDDVPMVRQPVTGEPLKSAVEPVGAVTMR